MTVGALLISDTPSSLAERGKLDEARKTLIKTRGSDTDTDVEFFDLIKCSEDSKSTHREAFITILERRYRPHLVMSIALPFFSQMSGINIVGFYAPILFQSVGYGSESALIAAIVLGTVNLAAIVVSTLMVDRCGRRILFITGAIQMLICQVLVACVLVVTTGVSGTETMSKGYGTLVLVLMCMFCAAFQLSSGCLAPLVMSEIFPTRIRAAGQSMGIAVMSTTSFVLISTNLLDHVMPLEIRSIPIPCWMACGYDRLYGSFLAGDKGNSFGLYASSLTGTGAALFNFNHKLVTSFGRLGLSS